MVTLSIPYLCFIASVFSVIESGIIIKKPPYGYPCAIDGECRISKIDVYLATFADQESKCINGICDCDESEQNRVFENGNFRCFNEYSNTRITDYGECRASKPNTCINGTCEKRHLDNRCFCQDGSVLVGNTCREYFTANYSDDCTIPESGPVPVCDYKNSMHCNNTDMKCACLNFTLSEKMETASATTGLLFYDEESRSCISTKDYSEKYPSETLASLDEFCGIIEKTPKVCDEENMHCKDSKCKCKRKFYPVESNGTCESYQSYVDAHNLTSYKVAPGLYCYSDNECITGLVCHKNLCDCPYPCTYDNVTIACDCGKVSATEGASRAILVGVLGGGLIIVFWYRMIKKTLNKGKEKSRVNGNYNGVTSEPPPGTAYIPPAYGTSPNRYPSTAAYDTNDDDDIPLKPSTGFTYTTSSTTVFTTPSTTSHTTAPFTSTFSTTESPNPSSTSNPPYPTSTSSTTNPSTNAHIPPYPPTNAPYPPNPSTNIPPYPPNYSQPAGPVGFSSYPEPTSSAILAAAPPYGAPSDAFMPPPYTPTTQNDKPGDDIYKPIIS